MRKGSREALWFRLGRCFEMLFDVLEDVLQNGLTVTITSGLSNNRTESPAGERLVPLMEQEQSILWLKL